MSKDMIGDFLTIIRNGVLASKKSVSCSHSRMRQNIAQILKDEGFIKDFSVEDNESSFKTITVVLKYVQGESVIHELTRISKPSSRIYNAIGEVKPVIGGLGVSILTTNKGVMTAKQAKIHNVGGEIICTVW
jgi:small subunit ribosomal protein S8